jgi:hypothetical protein
MSSLTLLHNSTGEQNKKKFVVVHFEKAAILIVNIKKLNSNIKVLS